MRKRLVWCVGIAAVAFMAVGCVHASFAYDCESRWWAIECWLF